MSTLTGQAIVDALRSATATLAARATAAHGVTLTDLQAVADAAQVGEYALALPARAGLRLYCYHPQTKEVKAVPSLLAVEGWLVFWAASMLDARQYADSL